MPHDSPNAPAWWQPYAAEFPGWHVWRGTGAAGLYARLPRSSPPIVVRAADPADLAAAIRAWYKENPR